MTSSERVQTLRTLIDEIINVYRPEIYSKKIFQESTFENYGKSQFDKAFKLIEKINDCDLDMFPDNYLDRIYQYIKKYKNLFEQAKSLDETGDSGSTASRREEIVRSVEQQYGDFFEAVQHVVSFSQRSEEDFKKIVNEASQELAAVKKAKEQSDEALSAIRTVSAKSGAQPNADHHRNAAKEHVSNAQKWFGRVVRLLVALGIFIVVALVAFIFLKQENTFKLEYPEIACALVIVGWVYAIGFCSKNYYTEKHNEIVNEHKARSLLTFPALLEGTGDDDARAQILLHACTAIFANNATGFNKHQDIPLPPTAELVRQAKRVVDKM
ncbi:MAG: hypothetical protein OYH77_06560 [Pseudomonadota bacterium]|nr:hypothetical protein [Pseudomonadota bacterium]